MKKIFICIACSFFIFSCEKEKSDYPKEFIYNSSEFNGGIEAYNSNGELLNVLPPFIQNDFLFPNEIGIYPIDKIILLSENEVQMNFTSRYTNTSFTVLGSYLISKEKISIEVHSENPNLNTPYFTAGYNNNELIFSAYGIKTCGPENGIPGKLIKNWNGMGSFEMSELLVDTRPIDTLYIQKFNLNYSLK